jgi:hypothetical protein
MQPESFPTHMSTNALFRNFLILLMASFAHFHCVRSEEKTLSKGEILALLPRGIDMDPEDMRKAERLVSIGPSAHEVLGAELLRLDDWTAASNIISVFVRSSGDKSIARRYLVRFLEISRNEDPWTSVRTQAAAAIRKLEVAQTAQSPTQKEIDTPGPEQSIQMPKLAEFKPALTTSEGPPSSTSRRIIVVLIVAVCGLLWMALKRRS